MQNTCPIIFGNVLSNNVLDIKACNEGYFGEKCVNKCNDTCKGCNIVDGVCNNGCYPGWKGNFCHEECNDRLYGSNCSMLCGNCLSLEQCQSINGTCINGCDEGYEGILCKKACKNGTFGRNCLETCKSTCYGCNRTNGKCETGCHPGWKRHYCHEVDCYNKDITFTREQHTSCRNGSFGLNCLETCMGTCYGCNRTNGKCKTGCHPGWQGDYCHKKCDGNEYGDNCNETCRKCMDSEPCHHVNGSCVNGCESGYQGNKCDRVCDFGFYGPNCKIACSTFCEVSRDCHPMTGACKSGCKAGVKGSECLVVQDNYQIKFYGIMISFCVTFPLTELCLFYKIMKRIINSQERKDKTYNHQRDEVFLLKRDDSAVPETQENNQVLKGE